MKINGTSKQVKNVQLKTGQLPCPTLGAIYKTACLKHQLIAHNYQHGKNKQDQDMNKFNANN